jgi:plastocyanin
VPCLLLAGCLAQPGASLPAAAGPAGDTGRGAAGAGRQVVIDNFTFSPATLTVPAGTAVTWVNHDDVPHTVTSPARPRLLDSPPLDTDETFTHVFDTPGTYEYYCTVHPRMTGKIIVP